MSSAMTRDSCYEIESLLADISRQLPACFLPAERSQLGVNSGTNAMNVHLQHLLTMC